MQAVWIIRTSTADEQAGRRGVLVFAAGWAGSDELVRHLVRPNDGWDLLCLFDYRTQPSETEKEELINLLRPYRQRRLAAWSFGVWAAERIFGGVSAATTKEEGRFWDEALAIGGTPAPIDDLYGIPRRAFDVTVRSIGGTGTGKFLERMCGTPDVLREYYRHRSTRPLEEIYDELVALRRQAEAAETGGGGPAKGFWTEAIVGGRDAIFPPANLERYWSEAGVTVVRYPEMPHYPFGEPALCARMIR